MLFVKKMGQTKCSEAFKKLMVSLMISLLTFKANFSEQYNGTVGS